MRSKQSICFFYADTYIKKGFIILHYTDSTKTLHTATLGNG